MLNSNEMSEITKTIELNSHLQRAKDRLAKIASEFEYHAKAFEDKGGEEDQYVKEYLNRVAENLKSVVKKVGEIQGRYE